jgi:NAD(P)H-dependent FMN reductase
MLKIAIIVGSTRPGRKGDAIARWAYEIARRRTDADFELLDIASFNLESSYVTGIDIVVDGGMKVW